MKNRLAILAATITATALVGFGQARAQEANAKAEKELIKLEEDECKAVVAGDAPFFDRLWADDFVDTLVNGMTETKAQETADIKSGTLKVTSVANEDYKARVYGDAAVVTFKINVKGQYQSDDISGQYRETDTWIKKNGRWQIVASHESKVTDTK